MDIKQMSSADSSVLEGHQHDAASEGHARVLLVESDPTDAERIQGAFENVPTDTTIEIVKDGDEAFEYLQACLEGIEPVPDLVLLDLDLPTMNGFELLEAIRDDDQLVHLPVLVLTNSSSTNDVHESYNRAANAYLSKPSNPNAFSRIASAIERFWFQRASLPPA
jgi:CheY-like chemotaxis protein